MKTKFLLSHKFKRLGWLLFFPSLILASLQYFGGAEPEWLDWKVIQLFHDEFIFGADTEKVAPFIAIGKNNVADELTSSLLLISCMLLVFGREKDEDELIMKLRLESILWAALVNGLLVLFCILFTYDMTFFLVMVFNLFLLFILFIARFHWVLYKFRKQAE